MLPCVAESFGFCGDALDVVRRGSDIFVSLRAVCDALGIDHAGQRVKLAEKDWAVVATIATTAADGKRYEMTGVNLRTLPMWLATISPSRVSAGARGKLVAYQTQAADVLADHFLGARSRSPSHDALLSMVRAEARRAARGAIRLPDARRSVERAAAEVVAVGAWLGARTGRAVTMTEVMRDALEMEPKQMDKPSQMRVAVALRQLGWEPSKGTKGHRVWRKV